MNLGGHLHTSVAVKYKLAYNTWPFLNFTVLLIVKMLLHLTAALGASKCVMAASNFAGDKALHVNQRLLEQGSLVMHCTPALCTDRGIQLSTLLWTIPACS